MKSKKAAKVPHPGSILKRAFLEPNDITPYRLSNDIKIPQSRLSKILNGTRGITADTALRLSAYFGIPSQYFMQLQVDYELSQKKNSTSLVYRSIQKFPNLQVPAVAGNFIIGATATDNENDLKLCVGNKSLITQRNFTVFHISDGRLVDVTQENDPVARYGPADTTCSKETLLEQFNSIIYSSILITE